MTGSTIRYGYTLLRKRNVSTTAGFIALALLISSFFAVNVSSVEYVEITSRGSSMYPTIMDGDRVRVKLRVNGSLIDVGDIIVYSTIATGADLGYMWIGHRVVEKHRKDGTWYFKTKGDNNPEADSWEVPEYWLLGVVVNIEHTGSSNVHTDTSSRAERSHTTLPKPFFLEGTQTLLILFGSAVLGATIAVFRLVRRRQENILKKANILSCYTCKHCQVPYMHRPELVNGRVGVRKVRDFSRGFCRYLNQVIEDFPRRDCEHYETKTYASL